MSFEHLAEVAIRARIPGTNPVFTYRVPAPLHALVRVGQLVWVPLRRQRMQGIVLDCYASEAGDAHDANVTRLLDDIADPEAQLTPAQIKLARWLSDYYHAPLYEALALMLPPGVAQEAEITWRATAMGLASDLGALPEGERAVLYYLRQQGETAERDLRKVLRGSDADLRALYLALYERGLLTRGAHFSRPRARPRIERLARLSLAPAALDSVIDELGHAPKQRAVLALLRERGYEYTDEEPGARSQEPKDEAHLLELEDSPAHDPAAPTPRPYPLAALYAATGANAETLRALERRGAVELSSREVRRDPLAGDNVPPDVPPPLSSAQERVWSSISRALASRTEQKGLRVESNGLAQSPQSSILSPQAFLLHGVTGSGKTEIYLRAIGRALRQGKQTLVLVPEIALTAQLVRRFAARFPGQLAVLHSGLSLGERYDEWRRLRRGEAKLAIGSRSAVFAPLPNLGLIIVDEEHETSYKHDGAPRYHARDAAQKLADLTGSVLILGSATPSVESYAAVQAGRMTLLEINERVGMSYDANGLPHPRALPLPPIRIVDMRQELQHGNRSIFSRPLQSAMHQALEREQQIILFLNRRGAASAIVCRDCGQALQCPNCSSSLAVHFIEDPPRTNGALPESELVCHSCNHRALIPMYCPECWSPRIKAFGIGTQRVVEDVEAMFPEARVLRWDRDTVGRKGDHTRLLDQFLDHKADVLVGTQMIAKGLDFPLVSVVGVVAADTALNLPDFRSGERTFQLLTQVAGRAGRRVGDAQVVLQTYAPEHYALLAAQEHDYRAFFTQEIAFRQQTGYPPFARLVRFVYSSGNDARCQREAEKLAAAISERAVAFELADWSIIGPAPAFFHRQRNRFRWHVILRTPNPAPLLEALSLPSGWSVDVDPVNVM